MIEYIKKGRERELDKNNTIEKDVRDIIDRVKSEGDEALRYFSKKYDGHDLDDIRVSKKDIELAYEIIDPEIKEKIARAHENIKDFAICQKECIRPLKHEEGGKLLGHSIIPVNSAACYVPGGSYPLYSTALMLCAPAKVAGVERIIAITPISKDTGKVNPTTLVALDIAGADEIYSVGGAQGIAAACCGTESINPVDVIVGPGNSYVTEAKRQCYGKVGIDFLAGPSEVLIVADSSANPEIIAADILAQAEHDVYAKSILVTNDRSLANAVNDEVYIRLENLVTALIARKSWEEYGEILLVDDMDDAIAFANEYAPEHLEVMVDENRIDDIKDSFKNYGAIFLGENSAEVFGDYASGPNHTLPTLGASRYTGGLWVGTFLKVCSFQRMSREEAKRMAPDVAALARGEGLIAHAKAAEIRSR